MVNKSSVLAWSADEYSEEGSGTVLALTIIAALLVLTVVIAGLIGVVSANRRASAAADLSALAAADAYRGLTEGDPCAVAASESTRNGGGDGRRPGRRAHGDAGPGEGACPRRG